MTTTPHNRTETSRSRAEYLDESGTAAERAQDIRAFLEARGPQGSTSKEYARHRGFDSLPTWVTGAFSTLHELGHIVRIDERRPQGRGSAYVYVTEAWVGGRPTVPFKSNTGVTMEDRQAFYWAIDSIAAAKESGKRLDERWDDLAARLKRLA